MKQKEDTHQHHAPQGKIEIETPSPSNVCGESTTDQWADYGGDPIHGSKEALIHGPFLEWDGIDDYHKLAS